MIASSGEWTHVRCPEDVAHLELSRQLGKDVFRDPVADHQPAAAHTQRLVEVGQALEQELGARA